jgi:hypothetical protein
MKHFTWISYVRQRIGFTQILDEAIRFVVACAHPDTIARNTKGHHEVTLFIRVYNRIFIFHADGFSRLR